MYIMLWRLPTRGLRKHVTSNLERMITTVTLMKNEGCPKSSVVTTEVVAFLYSYGNHVVICMLRKSWELRLVICFVVLKFI